MSKTLRMASQRVLLAGAIFPAAADDGKPRYVAGNGRDQGDCQNRFRPCRSLELRDRAGRQGRFDPGRRRPLRGPGAQQLLDLLSVTGPHQRPASARSAATPSGTRRPIRCSIGVPPEFRERFEAAGFTVIVDTKGLDVSGEEAQRMRKLTAEVAASEQSHAATPCVSNVSAGFACQSVSLLSHLSLAGPDACLVSRQRRLGFHDLNTGREYAFMGLQNGVAVVDITNPEAPEQVARLPGRRTTWRDIKVYQLYDAAADAGARMRTSRRTPSPTV